MVSLQPIFNRMCRSPSVPGAATIVRINTREGTMLSSIHPAAPGDWAHSKKWLAEKSSRLLAARLAVTAWLLSLFSQAPAERPVYSNQPK